MPSEDAKPVKMKSEVKDEGEDDEKSLSSIMENRKKKLANSNAKVKKEEPLDYDSDKPTRARSKESKVKKEENADDDDEDEKPLAKRSSGVKPDKDLKKKKKRKEEEKKSSAAEQKKRERKVYDLPGQKRDTPEERDPLRIFYETLYKQIPHSEMAQFWMMESGLLPEAEAKKVFEKKQKRSQQQKFSSPTKAVKNTASAGVKSKTPSSRLCSNKKKPTESKDPPKQSKKRKIGDANSDVDSDDDFIINHGKKKKRVT